MGNPLDGLKAALSKIAAIVRQLAQSEYPYDLDRLNIALQAIFEGRFEAVGGVFPSQRFAHNLIPTGWTIESDVKSTEFEVSDLEFILFLNEGEPPIKGDFMRERAVTLNANLGLADGKKILADQDKIPVELRGKWIVLTGTVLHDRDGKRRVACLYWGGGRWYLDFGWLAAGDWDSRNCLARRKPR